ncbi:helix-turn-helix domain-containing protein [Streptomyces sp. 4F14]|uniref:helix-turn-helix domain-containing protein n=1 Tax=Streptomyces sp. 4F14 TaxID=3394380 RepID=UPI003A8798BF
MSLDAREWVWDHSRSKGTARMVLALIADRCRDGSCVAYASVPTLMKRANASRTAVRDALAKLIADGELVALGDRKGPRGQTYYHLPEAARFLAERSAGGDRKPASGVSESNPVAPFEEGPEADPGQRNPSPGEDRFRPGTGAESDPQNGRELKVNGKSSSSAPLIPADRWRIDDGTRAWLQSHGHLDRLGEDALHSTDRKWRSYRAAWGPRTAAAWTADWRAWIARERTPAPDRPNLPGGTPAPPAHMTRAEAHMAALLAAIDKPTRTE